MYNQRSISVSSYGSYIVYSASNPCVNSLHRGCPTSDFGWYITKWYWCIWDDSAMPRNTRNLLSPPTIVLVLSLGHIHRNETCVSTWSKNHFLVQPWSWSHRSIVICSVEFHKGAHKSITVNSKGTNARNQKKKKTLYTRCGYKEKLPTS